MSTSHWFRYIFLKHLLAGTRSSRGGRHRCSCLLVAFDFRRRRNLGQQNISHEQPRTNCFGTRIYGNKFDGFFPLALIRIIQIRLNQRHNPDRLLITLEMRWKDKPTQKFIVSSGINEGWMDSTEWKMPNFQIVLEPSLPFSSSDVQPISIAPDWDHKRICNVGVSHPAGEWFKIRRKDYACAHGSGSGSRPRLWLTWAKFEDQVSIQKELEVVSRRFPMLENSVTVAWRSLRDCRLLLASWLPILEFISRIRLWIEDFLSFFAYGYFLRCLPSWKLRQQIAVRSNSSNAGRYRQRTHLDFRQNFE